ncbi:NEK4 kinase, partial [Atractosteus spatula]|nr:NEK4 kinase [Atractosteus spatula]
AEKNAMDMYVKVLPIGRGASAEVFLMKHIESKKLYAIKRIQIDSSRKTQTKEAVLQEAEILRKLRHPHIVMCHNHFFDSHDEYIYIVMDYCDGGTLDDRIKGDHESDEEAVSQTDDKEVVASIGDKSDYSEDFEDQNSLSSIEEHIEGDTSAPALVQNEEIPEELEVPHDEVDLSEYLDDFEEEVDLTEVVSNAKTAMEVTSQNDTFQEEVENTEAGGLSAALKTLREKYIGKHKIIIITSNPAGILCMDFKSKTRLR